jgi:hypothetical protein
MSQRGQCRGGTVWPIAREKALAGEEDRALLLLGWWLNAGFIV